MGGNKKRDTKDIALGGILIALTIITLYAKTVIPTAKLSLYALSSFFVSIIVIESGIGMGWTFYVATSCISFFLIPDTIGLIPYFIFFGNYGIIKCYIERLDRLVIEYILKIIYFNLSMGLGYFLLNRFANIESIPKNPMVLLIILGLQVVFIVYDYIYTLLIGYYRRRIKKLVGKR